VEYEVPLDLACCEVAFAYFQIQLAFEANAASQKPLNPPKPELAKQSIKENRRHV